MDRWMGKYLSGWYVVCSETNIKERMTISDYQCFDMTRCCYLYMLTNCRRLLTVEDNTLKVLLLVCFEQKYCFLLKPFILKVICVKAID